MRKLKFHYQKNQSSEKSPLVKHDYFKRIFNSIGFIHFKTNIAEKTVYC